MYKESNISALIVAAGTGKRFGGNIPKQFIKIGSRTVLEETCLAFEKCDAVDDIVVVCSEEYLEYTKSLLSGLNKLKAVVLGGAERQDSVKSGIDALCKKNSAALSDEIVLVHDAARPYLSAELIDRVVFYAYENGAAIPVVSPKDTIRTAESTLDRGKLFTVQTPQGFKLSILKEAYDKATKDGFIGTDEASIVEKIGYKITLTEGEYKNRKITTTEDITLNEVRTGMGYDVHKLSPERECVICGVKIPHETGLLGHSDADVATHALMDAMLGAAAMGDIGRHFPDTSKEYEGISSILLLEKVKSLICNKGYSIGNVDITIVCQRPKIAPHIDRMTEILESTLEIPKDRINIKATTTERLGFTGREEGIAATAVCTLKR